jgi:hypothetical protein
MSCTYIHDCPFTDVALAPLVDALRANTHLRVLDCRNNRLLSDAFMRDWLLPAVRPNPWLEAKV